MDPHFKDNIILMAEVIVPELHRKKSLQYAFIKNFKQIFTGLEEDSSKKIKLLVRVIEKLSYIYHFTGFKHLDYQKRQRFIEQLFNFPFGKITGGMTGIRSLILISYYGIDEIWNDIHYS